MKRLFEWLRRRKEIREKKRNEIKTLVQEIWLTAEGREAECRTYKEVMQDWKDQGVIK